MSWVYCENVHKRAPVEALANEFMHKMRQLIDQCESAEAMPSVAGVLPEFGGGRVR